MRPQMRISPPGTSAGFFVPASEHVGREGYAEVYGTELIKPRYNERIGMWIKIQNWLRS